MEPSISCDVMLSPTTKEIWDSLKDTFNVQENINRMYNLCEEILSKQGGKPLKEYYSMVEGRWEELSLYQPYPADQALGKHKGSKLKVASFLSGLDAQHESARNQLLTGSELLSLNVTYLRLSRLPAEVEPINEVNEIPALLSNARPSSTYTRGRGTGRDFAGRGRSRNPRTKDNRFFDNCQTSGHLENCPQ